MLVCASVGGHPVRVPPLAIVSDVAVDTHTEFLHGALEWEEVRQSPGLISIQLRGHRAEQEEDTERMGQHKTKPRFQHQHCRKCAAGHLGNSVTCCHRFIPNDFLLFHLLYKSSGDLDRGMLFFRCCYCLQKQATPTGSLGLQCTCSSVGRCPSEVPPYLGRWE